MSRISGHNRHNRAPKQSILFDNVEPTQQTNNSDNQRINLQCGTIDCRQDFSIVNVDQTELKSIQSINTNASHRNISESMYEDTNTTASEYKNKVIQDMTKDVLAQADFLRKQSAKDNRGSDVQTGYTSYGAQTMNLLAAERIVNGRK